MKDTNSAAKAHLARCLDAYLSANHFFYARKDNGNERPIVFDIICETSEKGLAEQRISAFVNNDVVFFEAGIPVIYSDQSVVLNLINTLNLTYTNGTYQYDVRDGELNWVIYLSARDGKWPGDDNISTVIAIAPEMAGLLYRRLVSIANASAASQQ